MIAGCLEETSGDRMGHDRLGNQLPSPKTIQIQTPQSRTGIECDTRGKSRARENRNGRSFIFCTEADHFQVEWIRVQVARGSGCEEFCYRLDR